MIFFLKFPLVPTLGGAEFHTLKLALHFQAQGQEIKLITSDQHLFRLFEKNHLPRQRIFAGWEPTSKWSLLLWPLTFLIARRRLKKIIHQASADSVFFCQSLTEKLILSSFLPSPPASPSAAGRAGDGEGTRERSKVIFLEHKIPGKWLTLNPLKLLYLKYARTVRMITVSHFAKQKFINLGVPEKNIEVIYPAVQNSPNPSLLKRGAPSLLQREGWGEFTIGILGRLDPEKGVLEFLQSVIPGLVRNPSWQILIAGEGSQKREIENLAQNHPQIRLLGFVSDLDEFFSKISVLIYPTLVPESFGLSILDAMSRGVPVVASNLGAIPEIIKHNENGYLVPPPSIPPHQGEGNSFLFPPPLWGRRGGGWLEYLESLQKPELYKRFSTAALATAQTFSEEKMFSAIVHLLQNQK